MKNIIMVLTLATFMVSINCASWKKVNSNDKTTVAGEKLPSSESYSEWLKTTNNPSEPIEIPVFIAEEIKPDLQFLDRLNKEISKLESEKEERIIKSTEISKIGLHHEAILAKISSLKFDIRIQKDNYNSRAYRIDTKILESVGLPTYFELPNKE